MSAERKTTVCQFGLVVCVGGMRRWAVLLLAASFGRVRTGLGVVGLLLLRRRFHVLLLFFNVLFIHVLIVVVVLIFDVPVRCVLRGEI